MVFVLFLDGWHAGVVKRTTFPPESTCAKEIDTVNHEVHRDSTIVNGVQSPY
eukprot:m.482600 g.482600  ORF g.482600 m.482600 type:complete len:52 (+) comp21723_c0_seq13:2710-2865(+)